MRYYIIIALLLIHVFFAGSSFSEEITGGCSSMFDKEAFSSYLKSLKADDKTIENTLHLSQEYFKFLDTENTCYDYDGVEEFSKRHIAGSEDALQKIIAMARVCKFTGREKGLIYLITLCNTIGVLENIRDRSLEVVGKDITAKIFDNAKVPALGSPIDEYPDTIRNLLENMKKALPPCKYRKILAGNNHQIPAESFITQKQKYQELGSIDEFLKFRQKNTIEEMEKCMNENRLWYEQKITPEVIHYMRENQEVNAGIRSKNRIYITKIPYMVDEYLKTEDSGLKPFLACHCPFVRASLKKGSIPVPGEWCYCSGGFEKFLFDVIFGQDTEVELLESVLAGDKRCRFSITIPEECIKEE